MDILGKLFSSNAIVKIMRLFLLNSGTVFESADIVKRSKVTAVSVRTELAILSSIKFVNKKVFYKIVPVRKGSKKTKKKKVVGWVLNEDFQYLYALRLLLSSTDSVNRKDLVKRFSKTGKIKLVVLSGVFLHEDTSRLDVLVVGDNINKKGIESALRHIESEVGKELSYASMDTKEFNYRLGMYDKFIRDVLDYPHEKIVNKIGV